MNRTQKLWHCFAYLPMFGTAAVAGVTTKGMYILPCLGVAAVCWVVGILKRGPLP